MATKNLQTDFNVSPYYDDYDENKKFLRILFRPGFPVQARELTQLQTIINNQIARFGESFYEDGDIVSGLQFNLEDVEYIQLPIANNWTVLQNLIRAKSFGTDYELNDEVKLTNSRSESVLATINANSTFSLSLINNVVPTDFFGPIPTTNFNVAVGAEGAAFEVNYKITTTSGTPAIGDDRPWFLVQGFSTQTSTDAPTLYGKYLTGTEFQAGDTVGIWDDDQEAITTTFSGVLPASFGGDAQIASVDEGIIFTNGFFVLVNQQTIAVSKYDVSSSARVGVSIEEVITDELDDETLLDNAAGSPNENAPGAHRFGIVMNLQTRDVIDQFSDIDADSSESFYELARVVQGEIVDRRNKPEFGEIGTRIAENVSDINGDFVIKQFKITFEDNDLFDIVVDSGNPHTTGSTTLNVVASSGVSTGEFLNKIFVYEDIPFEIVNAAVNGSVPSYTLTLSDCPSWLTFADDDSITITDPDNFKVRFTPGEAYVAGRKFKTIDTNIKTLLKTRDSDHLITDTSEFISASFGNYLVLDRATGIIAGDFTRGSTVDLHADAAGAATKIGDARLKQLKNTVNDQMELYFFNAEFDTASVAAVSCAGGTNVITSANLTAQHEGGTTVINGVKYRLVKVYPAASGVLNTTAPAFGPSTLTVNYDISAVKSIVTSSSSITLPVSSDVQVDTDGDTYFETQLLDSENNQLIFKASDDIAATMSGVQYIYQKVEDGIVIGSNQIGVTLNSNETFNAGASFSEIFILTNVSGLIPVTDIQSTTIGGTITLAPGYDGETAIVAFPVIRTDAPNVGLEFRPGNNQTLAAGLRASAAYTPGDGTFSSTDGQIRLPAANFAEPNVYQYIGMVNISAIKEIYEYNHSATDNSVLDPTVSGYGHTIVTNNFLFDDGQRDDIVDMARIALKPGSPAPKNDIIVVVDRFFEDTAGLYYDVDSYPELYYDYLPDVYTADGTRYDVRSSFDFRIRASEVSSTQNMDDATFLSSSVTYSTQVLPPVAEAASLVQFGIQTYVGRQDKVVITPDLDFRIVQGVPDVEPQAPESADRSLVLYDIYQFPFSSTKTDIQTTPYNHNRFTMKDISAMNTRLTRLEKAIQLDKVEKAILSAEVSDESNTNLLKTGVLVDSFSNTAVADVSNTFFRAALDIESSQLRPSVDQYTMSLVYASGVSTGFKTTDGIVLGPYDNSNPVAFVDQALATRTINLNPFAVVNWVGEMTLKPEKDFWKDIVRLPDVVTDVGGSNEAWKFLENNIPDRTEWNNWNTRWSGNQAVRTGRSRRLFAIFRRRENRYRDWTTYEAVENQQRTGVTTSFDTQVVDKSLGDKIVDSSVIPFMRAVPGGIRFRGQALKPNTNLYAFFDGQDITEYLRPGVIYGVARTANLALYQAAVIGEGSHTINGQSCTLTGLSSDVNNVYFHLTPNSRTVVYGSVGTGNTVIINGTTLTSLVTAIDQQIGGAFRLRTGPTGEVTGIFDVPAGVFKTGTRVLKLTDSSTNVDSASKTSADRDFISSGLKNTVQENIISSREPVLRRTTVQQSRTIRSGNFSTVYSNSPTVKRWKDPVAQSFRVEPNDFPSGLYLHSVDLWFTSVDPVLPVTVQLRPMVNGYPSSNTIIPFGEVTLSAADITSTSVPGESNYTRFTFTTPVYVQPGEYAVCLMSNSLNYEVYSALIGEKVLSPTTGVATDRVVNKQPYAGVLFKSQNASTWVAAVEQDLMMRLNRVSFTTGSYVAQFDVDFDNAQLEALDPFKVTANAKHFNYDSGLTNSRFTYNHFQINAPEIASFDDVEPMTHEVQTANLNFTTDIASVTSFQNTLVNSTITPKTLKIIKPNQTPSYFSVKTSFDVTNEVISPQIDEEQMNVIFIQNLIDQLEPDDSDVTITNSGTGYAVDETFGVYNSADMTFLGYMDVASVNGGGSITGVKFVSDAPALLTGDITISGGTAAGTAADFQFKSELDPFDGPAQCRYISKVVSLKSGFDSKDIKVIMSAYRPQNTAVFVYYQVKAAEDTGVLEAKRWNLMYELSNANQFSIDEGDFLNLEFVTYESLADGTINQSTRGGTFYTEGTTTYSTFNMYRIKIVMASPTTVITPILQNLGGIALIDPIAPALT